MQEFKRQQATVESCSNALPERPHDRLRVRLKVVLIITRLDRGGSAEAVLQLAGGLAERGHGVTLVTGRTVAPEADLNQFEKTAGVRVVLLPSLRREVRPILDVVSLVALRRLIAREAPDLVHTHTSKAGILGRSAASLAGCKTIVHSPHGHVFYGYFGALQTGVYVLLERMAARVTDGILTLTNVEGADHISRKIMPRGRYFTVPSGIDLGRFRRRPEMRSEVRASLGIPDCAMVVGWVGRFAPVKMPDVFVEAFASLCRVMPGLAALMVGEGELHQESKALARRLGIGENVVYTGFRRDVHELLCAMDVLVLTSSNEGFGRVIIEAMAAGVPVAATRVGGIPEIVRHGRTGMLVDPGDPQATALAVRGILDDSQLACRLVCAGLSQAELFSVERMVEETERIYLDLTGCPR